MATPIDPEKAQLATRIPLRIHRALNVECALKNVRANGLIALALERYLAEHGDPVTRRILSEGAEKSGRPAVAAAGGR